MVDMNVLWANFLNGAGFVIVSFGLLLVALAAVSLLLARYAEMTAAYRNKDMTAMEAWNTDNATQTSREGKIQQKSELNKENRQFRGSLTKLHGGGITIQKFTIKGDRATAEVVATLYADWKDILGMAGPKDKPHRVNITFRNRDTWVKNGGDWKIEHTQQLASPKYLIDGKPFSAPKQRKYHSLFALRLPGERNPIA